MNKKKPLAMTLVLTMLVVLSLFTAGCGKKTYSTLEEFLQDNPAAQSTLDAMSTSDSNGTAKLEVTGNTIVVKTYSNETLFGKDAQLDIQMKAYMDQYFSGADIKKQTDSSISQFAQASGIDASLISVRYEMYNPGASTPSYTYTYPQQ